VKRIPEFWIGRITTVIAVIAIVVFVFFYGTTYLAVSALIAGLTLVRAIWR
jgi:uncharacterized membrane protein